MILVYWLLLAIIVGYLRGGRLSGYLKNPLRGLLWPLAAFLTEASLGWLQKLIPLPPLRWLWAAVLLEYLCLSVFLFLNRREPGFRLVTLGTLANFAAMTANQMRMPVSPAIFDFPALSGFVERIQNGALIEYTLVEWGAPLWWLGDTIPVPWLIPGVASAGDFLMGAGLFWWIQRMMLRRE